MAQADPDLLRVALTYADPNLLEVALTKAKSELLATALTDGVDGDLLKVNKRQTIITTIHLMSAGRPD